MHVVTMRAVSGCHAQLADHFELVFAPILQIHQVKMQHGVVITHKRMRLTQTRGRFKTVGRHHFVAQSGKLRRA